MIGKRNRPLRAAAAAAAVLMLLLCAAGCARECPVFVSVMLAAGEGYTVKGDNPMRVRAGEDAVFSVAVEDGYCYVKNDIGAAFENGTLTVPNVLYPTTVSLTVIPSDGTAVSFALYDPSLSGTLYTNLAPGEYPNGSEAWVRAEPYEGYVFNGWSLGATLKRGGKLLTREAETTLTLAGDTDLYANFAADTGVVRSYATLIYNANGGTVAENGETILMDEVETTIYPCPSTLLAKDYFVRDGYTLIEYNTKADGTGDAYSLGSKVILPKGENAQALWCIWAKNSDESLFTVTKNAGRATITKYNGSEKTVVIPEVIGGATVTEIAAKAFEKNDALETLVLPKTLEKLNGNAILNCANLTTLYMFDNITTAANTAVAGQNNFHNFRLNAAMSFKFSNQVEGNFCRKWERLVTSDKPCIIVLSGSSSLNGLNSPMMEEAFDYKYTVVDYGTNAGTNGTLYMEFLSHFVEEGDILINAPEMGGAMAGDMNIQWKVFRGMEMLNNLWRYIDMARYTGVFGALTECNRNRAQMQDRSAQEYSTGMDEYGDLQAAARANLNSPNYHDGSTFGLGTNIFAGQNAKNLNMIYAMLEEAGCVVYFSCAPFNANGLTKQARERAQQEAYMQSLHDNLAVPVISNVWDYAIKGEWMYNSDYHPNDFGRNYRTENLIRDLKAQMVLDGLWSE